MKKFFVLALVICMLMSMASFAEVSPVVQDELPPVVVASLNEEGFVIVANVYDAAGNLIAEVLNDGSLIMTDVHNREEAASGIIVTRLTDAYHSVMEDVHHGDVECLLHEHDIRVDIDAVLASIDEDLDSHDLVMYELFDVMTSEEIEALLVNGNYMQITFEVAEGQNVPLVTMFTPNGADWKVLPTENAGERRFTVNLTEPGSIALLNSGRELLGVGESVRRVVTITPAEEGGEDVSMFSLFTPSVTGKTSPDLIPFEGSDGEIYVAYIRNDAGDVEIPVPDKNYILVTPYAERDYNADIQTHEHLEWGFDSIFEVENLGMLYTEHDLSEVIPDETHGTLRTALEERMQEIGMTCSVEELVVKDLFEVTAYGDYLHALYEDEFYLDITFETDLDPSKHMIVLHSTDSKHWHMHPIDESMLHADGTVTLHMYDLGVVAFVVEGQAPVVTEAAVQSPN